MKPLFVILLALLQHALLMGAALENAGLSPHKESTIPATTSCPHPVNALLPGEFQVPFLGDEAAVLFPIHAKRLKKPSRNRKAFGNASYASSLMAVLHDGRAFLRTQAQQGHSVCLLALYCVLRL